MSLSYFRAHPRLKQLCSALLVGALGTFIGNEARADAASWVSTAAPDILPDPGAAGSLNVFQMEYAVEADSLTVGQHGIVVAPVAAFGAREASKRPVVLFLHGDHASCLTNGVPSDPQPYTSCPPANRVPSYKGYLSIQRRLATRGYISISVDANEVMRDTVKLQAAPNKHLSMLSDWRDSAKAPNLFLFGVAQNADLSKVILVGHSVGAAAVDDAAYENKIHQSDTLAPTWKAIGQILISGSSFSKSASTVGIHTLNWLSECDNVNADAQGRLDQELHHDNLTLRSAMLVRGANHNYSNSFWTDDDDQYGTEATQVKTGLECRTKDETGQPVANPVRLSLEAQQTVLKSYITAAVSAFAHNDINAWNAIDGTPGHLPSSGSPGVAGPEIRISGKGRHRNDFMQISPDMLSVTASDPQLMTTNLCSKSTCTSNAGLAGAQRAQFWTASGFPVVSVSWSALGSTAAFKRTDQNSTNPTDKLFGVMLAHRQLGMRIAQLASTAASTRPPIYLNVKLRDISEHTLDLGTIKIDPIVSLAGAGPIWAQEVRIPVPSNAQFDFMSIVSLEVTPIWPSPSTGQIWIADAFGYLPN